MSPAKVSVRVKNNNDQDVPEEKTSAVIDLRGDAQPQETQGAASYDRPRVSGYNGEMEDMQPARDVPTQKVRGFLDIASDGHGFLRPKFRPSADDVYISASQIRKFQLRGGDEVEGLGRPPKDTERYFGLLKVEKVNDEDAEKQTKRTKFNDLTPIYPDEKLTLETGKLPL